MLNWFSRSGGLLYHMRAIKYRDSLWKDFRRHLAEFQKNWLERLPQQQKEHLILVGGSGGHCLSQEFLRSFQNIIHIDMDPWAPFFFKKRHPEISIHFIRRSVFNDEGKILPELLEKFSPSNSVWLWSNLLGQIGLHYPEEEVPKMIQHVVSRMEKHSWMSFHDLYSLPSTEPIQRLGLSQKFLSWSDAGKEISRLKQKKVILTDHLTKDSFPFKEKEILLWPLRPKQIHFIECGFTFSSGAPESH